MQKLTIMTRTGRAVFTDTHTKAGYKALWRYIKYMQAERAPFIVLPTGTIAHDLHDITSIDRQPYELR